MQTRMRRQGSACRSADSCLKSAHGVHGRVSASANTNERSIVTCSTTSPLPSQIRHRPPYEPLEGPLTPPAIFGTSANGRGRSETVERRRLTALTWLCWRAAPGPPWAQRTRSQVMVKACTPSGRGGAALSTRRSPVIVKKRLRSVPVRFGERSISTWWTTKPPASSTE